MPSTAVLNVEGDDLVQIQFESGETQELSSTFQVPNSSSPKQLDLILNSLFNKNLNYSYFIEDKEIIRQVKDVDSNVEKVLKITYLPQAIFKVRTVTRCSTTLSGHTEAVLNLLFSPDGKSLVSASGDTTVRVWNLMTESPKFTLSGHSNWVQNLAWSPDCKWVVSGGMDCSLILWDAEKGVEIGKLSGHKGPITSICFEPLHLNKDQVRMVSTSKDGTAKVWDVRMRRVEFTLGQHTAAVTCVRWSGDGVIYTGSRDKTIKMWDGTTGKLIKSLEGHAHWVNSLTLSTDFILRTGAFDHTGPVFKSREEMYNAAVERYNSFIKDKKEILASASDDFTIILWSPREGKKPVERMTGHQQVVNHISFSPDGRILASASFDKSVKLWNGATGKFISTLRGHVGACYRLAFSSDSRKLVTSSKDSTCKVWNLSTAKLIADLPGHEDEVYACDWSPGGDFVASGGKDRMVKLWRH